MRCWPSESLTKRNWCRRRKAVLSPTPSLLREFFIGNHIRLLSREYCALLSGLLRRGLNSQNHAQSENAFIALVPAVLDQPGGGRWLAAGCRRVECAVDPAGNRVDCRPCARAGNRHFAKCSPVALCSEGGILGSFVRGRSGSIFGDDSGACRPVCRCSNAGCGRRASKNFAVTTSSGVSRSRRPSNFAGPAWI